MIRKLGLVLSLLFLGTFFFTGAFVLTADTARADPEHCCIVYDGEDIYLMGVWNDDPLLPEPWCNCMDNYGAARWGCDIACPEIP